MSQEYALTFDRRRAVRLLIVPALFDEANRMRRLTVETMRRLDGADIDCFLPDLPGTNESLRPLETLTPDDWRDAMAAAAAHFGVTHMLAIRGGSLLAPPRLPGWRYAPVQGANILRQLIRARIVASREGGVTETQDGLLETARTDGITLAGYRLSADFIRQFEALGTEPREDLHIVDQDMIGGSGLWLRAEPGENPAQADALAAVIAIGARA